MKRGRPNPKLAKIHRSYTIEEVARLFDVHRNTVRQWIKQGLPTCDARRPVLVLGRHLVEFLRGRRAGKKRPCEPGQLYCMRCRAPRAAAGGIAKYQPLTLTVGNLVAICTVCETLMYRRVAKANIPAMASHMEISDAEGLRHIAESAQPSVNRDFKQEAITHDDAQPD